MLHDLLLWLLMRNDLIVSHMQTSTINEEFLDTLGQSSMCSLNIVH